MGKIPDMIALLGLRDGPTDGVADYCEFLSRALSKRGVEVQAARVPWDKIGWPRALWHLFEKLLLGAASGLSCSTLLWDGRGAAFPSARWLPLLS